MSNRKARPSVPVIDIKTPQHNPVSHQLSLPEEDYIVFSINDHDGVELEPSNEEVEDDVNTQAVREDDQEKQECETSTGSFSFPVLSRLWSGSPERMPRPNSKHLRKHKLCLHYKENPNGIHEEGGIDPEPSSERVCHVYDEVDDEESVYFDPELPFQAILGYEEEEEQQGYEASSSHPPILHPWSPSVGTTVSFPFPERSSVWSEGPVKLPRPKSKQLMKHKVLRRLIPRLLPRCCNFQ